MQTNVSANFTDKIPLDSNRNAFLHYGYGTNLQHNLPINYWKKSNFQTYSPNYGEIIQEKSLTDDRRTVPDRHLLNYDKISTLPDSALVEHTGPYEGSTFRSRFTPHNTHGYLAHAHSQVKLQDNNRQNTDKKDNGIPENLQKHSPFGYGQPRREYKFTGANDDYKHTSKDEFSHNRRQIAMSVEERSEKSEVRRLSGLDHKKMSSEEQELMLLDVLQQKANSSSRGFEASLIDMLGKSESIFFMVS
jgi:hypothetical protein